MKTECRCCGQEFEPATGETLADSPARAEYCVDCSVKRCDLYPDNDSDLQQDELLAKNFKKVGSESYIYIGYDDSSILEKQSAWTDEYRKMLVGVAEEVQKTFNRINNSRVNDLLRVDPHTCSYKCICPIHLVPFTYNETHNTHTCVQPYCLYGQNTLEI